MKKISIAIVFVLVSLMVVGCSSTTVTKSVETGRNPNLVSNIPDKDFTSLGIVTVSGTDVTLQDLLLEAQKLGADTVIDVYDEKLETSSSGSAFSTRTVRYLGGTAIKFTKAWIPEMPEAKE